MLLTYHDERSGGPVCLDLQVTGLSVGGDSTGKVTISWNDANTGTGAVTQGFSDSLVVKDSVTGSILDNASLNQTSTIAAGSSVLESGSFQLPGGFNTSHNLTITVATDVNGNVF